MKFREFPLCEILGFVRGYFISDRGAEATFDIYNYMIPPESFNRFQIEQKKRDCKTHILKQYPFLENVDMSDFTIKNRHEWMSKKIAEIGIEYLKIEPLQID